jgi:hypothetical protein
VRAGKERLRSPAGLSASEIDGWGCCDGGFSANLPLNAVLDPPPEQDPLCIAVDLLGDPGPPVFSVYGMMERSNDLLFANQTCSALATLEARNRGRTASGRVLLLLLACNAEGKRILQKSWHYGRQSLDECWRAGYEAGADLESSAPVRLQIHRIVVPSAVNAQSDRHLLICVLCPRGVCQGSPSSM